MKPHVDLLFLAGRTVRVNFLRFLVGMLLLPAGLLILPTTSANTLGSDEFAVVMEGGSIANDVLIQPDGKIVAGGLHGNLGTRYLPTSSYFVVLRFNADGHLDSTFSDRGIARIRFADDGVGEISKVSGLALQPDGKVVAAGYTQPTFYLRRGSGEAYRRVALVRLNPDGTLDSSFGEGGRVIEPLGLEYSGAADVALQPDGKIVISGHADPPSAPPTGGWDSMLARFNADGTLDTSFGTDGLVSFDAGSFDDEGSTLLIQPDGKLVVMWNPGSNADSPPLLARFTSDGSPDATFGDEGKVAVVPPEGRFRASALALQPDGKIVVGGGGSGALLTRYTADGMLDVTFGSEGWVIANANVVPRHAASVALQPDGRIVVTGNAGICNAYPCGPEPSRYSSFVALARYDSDGRLDTSFRQIGYYVSAFAETGKTEDNYATAIALQADGNVVVTGTFIDTPSDLDQFYSVGLARVNPQGPRSYFPPPRLYLPLVGH